MTPQERKVMELALEALTHNVCPPDCKDGMTDSGGVHPWGEAVLIPCPNCQTITAIKEALEKSVECMCGICKLGHQRTWVGLTQTQVKLLWEGVQEEAIKSGDSLNWVFYTHINEALKDKNS